MIESRTSMEPERKLIRRMDVRVHELDGEALVYDPTSANTHRLNPTALFIWRSCDGTRDARRIAEGLADCYDVALEAAMEHVERMLGEFRENNLVTAADASTV